MAYKEYRSLKVLEQPGFYSQNRRPSIKLQGKWLKELGFEIGDRVDVKCEDGRLTITKSDEIIIG
jgi:toxic protein SymE